MSEILPPFVVCALLMPLEAGILPFLGLAARAELPLCAVVILASGEASTLEGAIGCFLFGLLADVTYQIHPGLFTLSSLLLYIVLRVGPLARDIRGPFSFAALVAVSVPLQAALVFGLLWLAGRSLPEGALWSIAWGAFCTGLVAPLFYWLAAAGNRMMVREDPSLLRSKSKFGSLLR